MDEYLKFVWRVTTIVFSNLAKVCDALDMRTLETTMREYGLQSDINSTGRNFAVINGYQDMNYIYNFVLDVVIHSNVYCNVGLLHRLWKYGMDEYLQLYYFTLIWLFIDSLVPILA